MKKPDPRIFFFLVFLLNVLQSVWMPITEDEAYYWMYAQNLDWGYFDHPPMVALMIWLGDLIFKGTLGVRIISNIAWLITSYAIWLLVEDQYKKEKNSLLYFFLIIVSMPLLNLYGFVTTPDTPLLLFSAIYLVLFKRYIKDDNLQNTIWLGVVASLVLYSKYHGVLVIGLSFLAYPKLLLKRRFYISLIIGIVCFIPHIIWQYQHGFISIKYHLLYRTENELLLANILNYMLNVILVLNPFLFAIFIFNLIKNKATGDFPLHYHFLLWGGIVFFGLSAFRDHVEPHWIAFTVLPLIAMVHQVVLTESRFHKFFRIAAIISIAILMIARIALMLPNRFNPLLEDESAYYHEIQQLAGGEQVAFINSYHGAAKFTFYTGEDAFSYNCMPYGKKQYDYWPYEKTYQGADVFLVGDWPSFYLDTLWMQDGSMLYYKHVKDFQVLSRVHADLVHMPEPIKSGVIQDFKLKIENPYDYPLHFDKGELPLSIELFFFHGRDYTHRIVESVDVEVIPAQSSKIITGTFKTELPSGHYKLGIALRPGDLTAVPVSLRTDVEIVR
ncbi:MAG: glycosyltransferase family 39 protein [Bacteroidetes bacterium]|nr:glycosyltransferase family 39 protein [Bacteroidota bacterium]